MQKQGPVSLPQRLVARHLEGDVSDTERPFRASRRLRVFVLRHVQGVEVLAQGHEQVAMLGILLGDAEAEDIAVEGF